MVSCRETELPVAVQAALVLLLLYASVSCRAGDFAAEHPKIITNAIGMQMVLIPSGRFTMGSSDSDESASDREKPHHKVRITRPFYLGIYEVTQAEYKRLMGDNPSNFTEGEEYADRVSGTDTSRFPVDNISWEDAVEFCRELSSLPATVAKGIPFADGGGMGARVSGRHHDAISFRITLERSRGQLRRA